MQDLEMVKGWRGRTVIDREGKKVGELVQVYVDDRSREPWAAIVKAGDANAMHLAPLTGASPRGRELRISVSRRRVYDSPPLPVGDEHTVALEHELFAHYGRDYDAVAGVPRLAA